MNEIKLERNAVEFTPATMDYDLSDIKVKVQEVVEKYDGLVYTDDDIPVAKKEAASIKKLSKSLNDTRISLEKEYMEVFNGFKSDIKELTTTLDTVYKQINQQVKDFDETQKQLKMDRVQELFNEQLEKVDFEIELEQIFDKKWLNKSETDNKIINGIQSALLSIESDLKSIKLLSSPHEEVLLKTYFKDLNLVTTLELNATMLEVVKEPEINEIFDEELPQHPTPITLEKDDTINDYTLHLKCTESQFDYIVELLKTNNIKHLVG